MTEYKSRIFGLINNVLIEIPLSATTYERYRICAETRNMLLMDFFKLMYRQVGEIHTEEEVVHFLDMLENQKVAILAFERTKKRYRLPHIK